MLQWRYGTISDFLNKGLLKFNLGNEHFAKGNYEEAISEYIKVMQNDEKMY